jgi:lipoate-protein ligase A
MRLKEEAMKLFRLGHLEGQGSMLTFHALARMGVEGLVIVSPANRLVSIGYFQNAAEEIELSYCHAAGLPYMRREVGGGGTYLDQNQIFYQLIWHRDNPRFPRKVQEIYEWLSQPAVETYRQFGISTVFRPVNDIVTEEGRKITGEGGGDIEDCMVFVGGLLLDFDYRMMSRVLKVPDEKIRDKIYQSMEENLTTMKRELGEIPPRGEIERCLIDQFQKIIGPLEPAQLTSEFADAMVDVERTLTHSSFLHKKTPRKPDGVKIREGVEVKYTMHKAPGGLIRTVQEVEEQRLNELAISGDFTMIPKAELGVLEHRLRHAERDPHVLEDQIEDLYEKDEIESPGVTPSDLATAITKEG